MHAPHADSSSVSGWHIVFDAESDWGSDVWFALEFGRDDCECDCSSAFGLECLECDVEHDWERDFLSFEYDWERDFSFFGCDARCDLLCGLECGWKRGFVFFECGFECGSAVDFLCGSLSGFSCGLGLEL